MWFILLPVAAILLSLFFVCVFIPDPRKKYEITFIKWEEDPGFWYAATYAKRGKIEFWVSHHDRWLQYAPNSDCHATEAPGVIAQLLTEHVQRDKDKRVVEIYSKTIEKP